MGLIRLLAALIVGGAHAIVDYGASDSETRRSHAFFGEVRRCLQRKFANNQIKLRKVFACKALLEDGSELPTFFREERQIAFRAANVARKNHLFPPSYCRSIAFPKLEIMD